MPRNANGDDLPLLDPHVLMSAAGAREYEAAEQLGHFVDHRDRPAPPRIGGGLYADEWGHMVAVDSQGRQIDLTALAEPDMSNPNAPDPALESMFMDELPAHIRAVQTSYDPPGVVEEMPVHFDQEFEGVEGGNAPIEHARFQVGRESPPMRPFMGGAPQSQDGLVVSRIGADGRVEHVPPPRITTPAVAPRTRVGRPVPAPRPVGRPVPLPDAPTGSPRAPHGPPAAPDAPVVQGPSLWQRLADDD